MHLLCILFSFQDGKYTLLIGYPPADCVGVHGPLGRFENGKMPRKSHLTKGDSGFAETERVLS